MYKRVAMGAAVLGVLLLALTVAGVGIGWKGTAEAPGSGGLALAAPLAEQAQSAAAQVTIERFAFAPSRVQVPVGGTVTWVNKDAVAHTVTAGDNSWGSPLLKRGEQFSYTFAKEGVYDYFCLPHPWMLGKVVVGNPPESETGDEGQGDTPDDLGWMREHMEAMHGPGSFDAMRQWMDENVGPGAFDSMPCHQTAPGADASPRNGSSGMMGGGSGGMMGGRSGGMMGGGSGAMRYW